MCESSKLNESCSSSETYEDKLKNLNPISKPLAGKKLTKKIYKLIRKLNKDKKYLHDGLRLVQLKLRKGEKGLVVFAGDVFPIDVMSHLPGVCEKKSVPYCYIPSRIDLGTAYGVKRSIVTIMIKPKEEFKDLYNEILAEIKTLPSPY